MAMKNPTQSADFRPSVLEPDVEKTADVVPRIPCIINFTLNAANTWYEIKMPRNMVTWMMKARGAQYDLLYSYEPSHSTYMTLPAGAVLTEDTMPNRSIFSIYVSCATAGVVAEIEVWMYA